MKTYEITVNKSNIHIKDSYDCNSKDIVRILKELRTKYPDEDNVINVRSIKSMKREWEAHNVLYALGYKRERTGSVDLNLNEPWYRHVGYFILSLLW